MKFQIGVYCARPTLWTGEMDTHWRMFEKEAPAEAALAKTMALPNFWSSASNRSSAARPGVKSSR